MQRKFFVVFEAPEEISSRELINDLHVALGAYCTTILRKVQIKEILPPTGRTYPCDPDKNKECEKTGCFLNGGDCFQTSREEYRWEEKNL